MSPERPDSPSRRIHRERVPPSRDRGDAGPPGRRSASPPPGRPGRAGRRGPAVPPEGRFARWLRESTAGRSWVVRAPLLPVLAWIAWKHAGDIWWGTIFDGVNLVFHEIGHVVFGFFGSELLTVAGGTVVELAVPVLAAGLLARQRDAFGVGFATFWLGTAFASVGRYIYDTRSQIADRVSLGPSTGPDDWTFLLSRWDLVRQDRVIGMTVKEIGVAVMIAAIAWSAFVLWRMASEAGRADRAPRSGGPPSGRR